MKLNLHIERLVLDGLPIARSQGGLVQRAVEIELADLLRTGALSPEFQAAAALPSVQAGHIKMNENNNPTQLGKQIASAVFRGIGK
jgi:hypothetical protein